MCGNKRQFLSHATKFDKRYTAETCTTTHIAIEPLLGVCALIQMIMKIELDRDDIVREIKENFQDDVNLIVEIVDKTTNSWESVRNITEKLIEMLKKNEELSDLIERVS